MTLALAPVETDASRIRTEPLINAAHAAKTRLNLPSLSPPPASVRNSLALRQGKSL
jgi:hypothetical protein